MSLDVAAIPLRIATRGSPLALWQARYVAGQLAAVARGRPVVLVLIETEGDRVRDRALSQIGGDGLFTKEVQQALLDGRADVAVHSLKDLPTTPFPELKLAAVPARGPVGDALVSDRHDRFEDLPSGARVATSSLRRRAQLLHRRPDLRIEDLRGNVETRLRKIAERGLDAIILAEAGLIRLGLEARIKEVLDRGWMLPAVGQGALGLECRADDEATYSYLRALEDRATRQAVVAERAFLRALGGGCLVPIGSLGEVRDDQIRLCGAVLPVDGSRRIGGELSGPLEEAEELGRRLADDLLGRGAGALLHSR